MKKLFTISALLILAITTSSILKAQNCDFAQAGIRYNYSNSDGNGNCIINVDLYFDLKTNSGSKYVTLHIWPTAVYPNFSYSNPPMSADLSNATTIVIHHFQDHSKSHVDTVYKPDTQVQPQYLNMQLTIGPSSIVNYDRFTITNVNLIVPGGCDIPQSFTLDAWSTESESMNAVHCVDKGTVFYANNPRIIGLLNCNLPRTYNVQVFSIDPASMTIDYKVYVDNGDNVFNKITDTLIIKSVDGISISKTTNYNSGYLSYLPYSNLAPWANMNLWVEVTSASLPNSVIGLIENSCSALPIKLRSFTVNQNGSSVLLKWVTAGEFSNKGFYVERRIGNGDWATISFINSLAVKGTSQGELTYTYIDNVSIKGVIQYRLRQIDMNGSCEYSETRVVRMNGANDITIFPNPSSGNINIAFADAASKYDIIIYSADGKKIGEWQNIGSLLTVSSLRPGIYFIKINQGKAALMKTFKVIIQ